MDLVVNGENLNISENSLGDYDMPITQTTFSPPFKIFLHILYNLVFLCGVFGNLLVLYCVYSLPRMRTVTNYLLANLAIGDLIIASLCVPFTYISITYRYWPFGSFLCSVLSPFNAIGVLVSAFTLVALACEKYVAILHPLAPRLRKSRVGWVIALIWVAAAVISSPIAVVSEIVYMNDTLLPVCFEAGWKNEEIELCYSLGLLIVQYFLPLCVLAFTYSRIALVVWGIQHEKPAIITGVNGHSEINLNRNLANSASAKHRADNRSRKAVLLTLAVVVGYSFAWLPYNVNYIISRHSPEMTSDYISVACHWLAMSHCFYNPVIYAWINTSFKLAFKDTYNKVICCVKLKAVSNTPSLRYNGKHSSFSTGMTTVKWKSYRKISFSPEPYANQNHKEETRY